MSQTKWYGATDHTTQPMMFYLMDIDRCPEEQREELSQLCEKLEELSKVRDEYGFAPLELIASRLDHVNPFIAYRFTSDRAHREHNSFLVSMGGSLGRGMFRPFGSDRYTFDRFIR